MDSEPIRKLWENTLSEDEAADLETLSIHISYRPPIEERLVEQLRNDPPYVDFEEVGRGGMGVVYRARQISLDRDVAIKALRPKKSAGSMNARRNFLAEAYATGSLDHPNIIPLYDLGLSSEDELFIAMKLVGGSSWKQLMRREEKSLEEHLEILHQVCNAVGFAHSRGIVHNDLKPANVMVGEFGEVLVVDWGLAVSLEPRRRGYLRSKDTITSACGTPAYMPPELAAGKGAEIGPWTDVYMLGGLLYRLLAGHAPHAGENFVEVVSQTLAGTIAPLPDSVPEELRALCGRALSVRPADRPGSVREFQDALRDWFAHRDSRTIAATAWQRLEVCRKAAPRLDDGPARSELYLEFSAALSGFEQARALWEGNDDARRGEQAAREAFAESALRHGDLGLAEAQGAGLDEAERTRLLAAVAEERARKRRERRVKRWLRTSLIGAGCVLLLLMGWFNLTLRYKNEEVRAAQAVTLAQKRDLELEKERVEEQRERADRRGAIAQDALQALSVRVQSRLLDALGDAASQAVARELLAVALEGWEELRRAESEDHVVSLGAALTLLNIGDLRRRLDGDLAAARAAFVEAERICRALEGPEARRALAQTLLDLGTVARDEGDLDAAEQAFRDCLDLRREALRAQGDERARAEYGTALKKLGQLYQMRGESDRALTLLREQLELRRQDAEAAPADVSALRNYGAALRQLGQVHLQREENEQARALFRTAADIAAAIAAEHPTSDRYQRDLAKNLHNLGALAAEPEPSEAEALHERARAIRAALLAKSPASASARDDLCLSLEALARLALARGDQPKAEREAARALELRRTLSRLDEDAGAPGLWGALSLRAEVAAAAGREAEALALASEALALAERLVARGDRLAATRVATSLQLLAALDPGPARSLAWLEMVRGLRSDPAWWEAYTDALLTAADQLAARGQADEARALCREGHDFWTALAEEAPERASAALPLFAERLE